MTQVAINGQTVTVVEYAGQRVVTLGMVDALHQRPEGTARRNFNSNKQHFVEGEDYVSVCADEIRTRKILHISPKAQSDITLLTESGYAMLAKSFTDDLAWKVQRQLVRSYFGGKAPTPQLAIPSHAEALRMAADLVEKNQTLLNTVEIRQRELAEAAPKVAALEQLASLDGFHTLTQAAKSCGWPRDHFIQECSSRHWIYRDKAKKIWMGYSDKEKAGLLDYKPFEYAGSDGHVKAKPQVVFTSKGLSRIKILIGVYRKEPPRPFAKKPEGVS